MPRCAVVVVVGMEVEEIEVVWRDLSVGEAARRAAREWERGFDGAKGEMLVFDFYCGLVGV